MWAAVLEISAHTHNAECKMTSVIYAIINIVDDNHYVGQTSNKENRWIEHRKSLKAFHHHSLYLQRAWCKHGKDSFIFVVLENVDNTSDLLAREQHWMDLLQPEYNIAKVAGSRLGVRQSDEAREKMRQSHIGKSWHTEESRRLASERMIGNKYAAGQKHTAERIEARAVLHRGKSKSDEHKEKIAAGNRGKIVSEETRKKMSEAAKNRKKPLDKNLNVPSIWR